MTTEVQSTIVTPAEQEIERIAQLKRMGRDLKRAASTLGPAEVRYLVDYYYQLQRDRIRAGNQINSMKDDQGHEEEPHQIITWLSDSTNLLEGQIKGALGVYAESHDLGRWCLSNKGIGPVITAGLMAHIDITRAQTAGAIWSFAGQNPNATWDKKTKRPWNARLKTLCWKIGESFVKFHGHDDCFYGQVYAQRKALEIERNESGDLREQAEAKLASTKIGKTTDAYKAYAAGQLPPAHIHSRAKRYAVKLFLAHYHHVAYAIHYGAMPPKPYVISILGHQDMIEPPGWPM